MEQTKIGKFEVGTLPFKNYAIASLFVNLLIILSAILAQRFLPPEVPLFYGLAEGEEQLAPRLFLLLPSLLQGGASKFAQEVLILVSLGFWIKRI